MFLNMPTFFCNSICSFSKLNLKIEFKYKIYLISNFRNYFKVSLEYKKINSLKYEQLFTSWNKDIIKLILKQYEYLKFESGNVPSDISISQMSDLLEMSNDNERKKYFRHLFLKEIRKIKDNHKKTQKKDNYQNYICNRSERTLGIFDQNGQLSYQLWGNNLFGRISSGNLCKIRTEKRLRFASMFGQKLVIDLDYDDYMSLNECRIQVRHILTLLIDNLQHSNEPFDIYFTNCRYDKSTMKHLANYCNSFPLNKMSLENMFTAKSYLDIFPQDRLVYLTPDAKDSIQTYNHDDIYIIGAFLDKFSLNKPISHTKALREGIRQYKLPIDENVVWGSGSSKHLCIVHMVAILNHVKRTGHWREALKLNIPKRKFKK